MSYIKDGYGKKHDIKATDHIKIKFEYDQYGPSGESITKNGKTIYTGKNPSEINIKNK